MGEFNAEQRSILSENISKIVDFLNGELETDLIGELQEWLKGQGTVPYRSPGDRVLTKSTRISFLRGISGNTKVHI